MAENQSPTTSDQLEDNRNVKKAIQLSIPLDALEEIFKNMDIPTFFTAREISRDWAAASNRFCHNESFWEQRCKNDLSQENIEIVRKFYCESNEKPSWYTIAKACHRWKLIASKQIEGLVETIPKRKSKEISSSSQLSILQFPEHFKLFYGHEKYPIAVSYVKDSYLTNDDPRVACRVQGSQHSKFVTPSNIAYDRKTARLYFFSNSNKFNCITLLPVATCSLVAFLYFPGKVDFLNIWENTSYIFTSTGVLFKFVDNRFHRVGVRNITHIPQDDIIKRYAFAANRFAYLSNKGVMYLSCSQEHNALTYNIYEAFKINVTAVLIHGSLLFLGFENGMITAHYADKIENLNIEAEHYVNRNVTGESIERLECIEENDAFLLVVITSQAAQVVRFQY